MAVSGRIQRHKHRKLHSVWPRSLPLDQRMRQQLRSPGRPTLPQQLQRTDKPFRQPCPTSHDPKKPRSPFILQAALRRPRLSWMATTLSSVPPLAICRCETDATPSRCRRLIIELRRGSSTYPKRRIALSCWTIALRPFTSIPILRRCPSASTASRKARRPWSCDFAPATTRLLRPAPIREQLT